MTYSPAISLVVFLGICLTFFLIFRPRNGVYFMFKRLFKVSEKALTEDILKILFHNQPVNNKLTVNDLVNQMDYPDSHIVRTVEKMSDSRLICWEGDRMKLAEEGYEYALRVVRAHRLWEKYLSEKTGFQKVEWHKQAEEKEHELNRAGMKQLSMLLGDPQFDPHGDPIPTDTGRIASKKGVPLSSLQVGFTGTITHLEDEPEVLFKQILGKNVHLYSAIRVEKNNSEEVVFSSEGELFSLSPIEAGNVSVVASENYLDEQNLARLSSLKIDETAEVVGLSKECRGENRRRLLDLGFVKGAKIQIHLLNPLGDPTAYLIKETAVALRKDQASMILIKRNTP